MFATAANGGTLAAFDGRYVLAGCATCQAGRGARNSDGRIFEPEHGSHLVPDRGANMKVYRWLCGACAGVACLAVLFCGVPAAFGQAETDSANAKVSKRLIADYGYWSRTQVPPYSSAQIPFQKMTHINHAGVNFDNTGSLQVPDGFLEPELLEKAHSHGVKVMLLLGGDFSGVEATPGALAKLLKNVHAFIQKHGYNGIDLDWSIPRARRTRRSSAACCSACARYCRRANTSSPPTCLRGVAMATTFRTASTSWTTSM